MTTEERFEKIEAGIRDLIIVSRTVLSSIEQLGGTVGELGGMVGELREAQKQTDEKFNALIQAQAETEQKLVGSPISSTSWFAIEARTDKPANSSAAIHLLYSEAHLKRVR